MRFADIIADIIVDFVGQVDGERFEVVDPSGGRVEGTTGVTDDGVATFAAVEPPHPRDGAVTRCRASGDAMTRPQVTS